LYNISLKAAVATAVLDFCLSINYCCLCTTSADVAAMQHDNHIVNHLVNYMVSQKPFLGDLTVG